MPARKSSTSLAVDGPLRDEAATAAERAGMPVGQWLERALRMALDGETEPAQPEGVEIGELEAMVSLPRWRGRVRKVGHAALAICS